VWRRRRMAAAIFLGFLAASCAPGGTLVPAGPHRVPSLSPGATALIGSSHSMKLKGFHVLDISFVDGRNGFLLGGFTSAPITAVLRTSDGGRHWNTMASTPQPETHIAFSTPRLGWAFGPDLYVTDDGGQTWEQQRAGGPPVAVAAEGRSLWVVTGACRVGPCSFRVQVSADAGDTWRTAAIPTAIWGEHAELARVGNMGWVVGSTAAPHGKVGLLRTADGGTTWTELRDPCDHWFYYGHPFKPIFESHLAPINAHQLWLRCTDEPAGGSSDGVLFTSTNAGASWHLAFVGALANELHVAALSPTSGWETDGAAGYWLVRITADGRFHHPAVTGPAWADLQFVDARHGWAATGRTVFRTIDGGDHWLAVRPHPSGCG